MPNQTSNRPSVRQLAIVLVAVPVVVTLAVLSFTWPAARLQPRNLPVGVVGTSPGTAELVRGLTSAQPGAFDLRLFADTAHTRTAIRNRDIYGAVVVSPTRVEVLEAGAASPTVAQLLDTAGSAAAAAASAASTAHGGPRVHLVRTDVVPLSADDPRGVVLSAALLPLTICGIALAAVIGVAVRVRPAWRQLVGLTVASTVAAAGAYLVAGSWLGALPHHGVAVWATMAATILAIGTATAGLVALVGVPGLLIASALMIVVGNPLSGATSAPDLLPNGFSRLGQWLPPGAGASALRSITYFDGHTAGADLGVLVVWIVLGAIAVVVGHHAPIQFAARTMSEAEAEAEAEADAASRAPADHDVRVVPGTPGFDDAAPDDHPRHLDESDGAGPVPGRGVLVVAGSPPAG